MSFSQKIPRRQAIAKILTFAGAVTLCPQLLKAQDFLTVDEIKNLYWPGETLTLSKIVLTNEQKKVIQKHSKTRVRSLELEAWRSESGGWLFVDNVVGKHEFIDFALALESNGSVKGIDVLTYRESYGDQIRGKRWQAQFHGKTFEDKLKIDKPIKNISGATLSCVHITDGIRRLLHTWDIACNIS